LPIIDEEIRGEEETWYQPKPSWVIICHGGHHYHQFEFRRREVGKQIYELRRNRVLALLCCSLAESGTLRHFIIIAYMSYYFDYLHVGHSKVL